MRNVFSSFAVGLLGTILQTQTIVHTALLSQQITPTSPSGQFIGQVSALLQLQHGLGSAHAYAMAIEVLVAQISRLAAVLAFGDAYRFTFFAALVALALSLLLPGRGAVKASRAMMTGGH